MPASEPLITRLEELSMNALPALSTVVLDGWILRFSEGYSKRANSCLPLYEGKGDVGRRIEECSSLYRRMGLDTIFKVTEASKPSSLDEMLAARGYERRDEVSVQTVPLQAIPEVGANVNTSGSLERGWMDAFCRMSGAEGRRGVVMELMLRGIVTEQCYATARGEEGKIDACGMAVLHGEYVGLFDIITAAGSRRRGLGRAVTSSLLRWGRGKGATAAYLQVEKRNAAAASLYSSLGFTEAYTYWYRVRVVQKRR